MRTNATGPLALAVISAFAALAVPAAPIPIRGVTWQWCFKDPGLDFCLRTADAMSSLGYNAIMPEFGPVLQSRHYQSSRATFNRGDFRAFLRRAKERNLEVIPLLNTLGHSERSIPWPKPLGRGLDLREEENYAFLFNVLDEYLEDFAACGMTPRYIHLGCDEASSTLLANAEKYGSTPEALLLAHLLRLRDYCRSRSLGMIIWHDMLMSADDPLYDRDMAYHKTTSWKCRPEVPRDIVLMYWCYEPRSHYGVVTGLVNEGFEVWLCPWGREGMQRMANQAREENLPAVVVSTWMDSGGADVRRLSQTHWVVESLAETPTRTLSPESCLDEPPDDPVLRYIGALFPERDIAFRPLPATNAVWRAAGKPPYLERHAASAALLGKWPDGKTNFAELAAPYSVTCSNGTGRLSIDLANVARGTGQRVLYTREHGLSTRCNGIGCEVAVGPFGTVTEVTEWGVGDTGIPVGGFVVSWHAEDGYDFLRRAMKVGDGVELVGANGVRFQAGSIDGGESALALPFGGGRAECVSFLWAAGRALPMDGRPFGKVALAYSDGSVAEIGLAFGRDVACWDEPLLYWGGRDGVAVWPAFPESSGRHTGKTLTGWSWRNPHPEKNVLCCRIELTSAGREMGLLVAGVEMSRLLVVDVGTQVAVTNNAFSYALDTESPSAVKAADKLLK